MPPSCALLGGFAIGARVALLWQHYVNAWQSPAVIRQAHHTHAAHAHYARRRRLPLPAITPTRLLCAPFHFVPYYMGVVTRARNVSEYMLVLALCLVWFSHETYSAVSVDFQPASAASCRNCKHTVRYCEACPVAWWCNGYGAGLRLTR